MKEFLQKIKNLSFPIMETRSGADFTNLTQVVILKNTGFYSLYDLFVQAMNEAEQYYEQGEEGYMAFKEKYSTLYFPEIGDDYSAYLPISDPDLAKIADINGNVLIGDKLVSLIDITSYEQLQEKGLTPPSNISTFATSGTNSIATEETKENKVWVKTKTERDHSIPIIRVEVCFRKKGILGVWYNHNSGTEATLKDGYGIALYSGSIFSAFGFSSHDYCYKRASDGIDVLPVERDIEIKHHGTGKTLNLHVSYPRELL